MVTLTGGNGCLGPFPMRDIYVLSGSGVRKSCDSGTLWILPFLGSVSGGLSGTYTHTYTYTHIHTHIHTHIYM